MCSLLLSFNFLLSFVVWVFGSHPVRLECIYLSVVNLSRLSLDVPVSFNIWGNDRNKVERKVDNVLWWWRLESLCRVGFATVDCVAVRPLSMGFPRPEYGRVVTSFLRGSF